MMRPTSRGIKLLAGYRICQYVHGRSPELPLTRLNAMATP